MKYSIIIISLLFCFDDINAQSVDAGKRYYYYERYTSAVNELEKIVSANTNNTNAVYWLGQALIQQKDSAAAEKLYRKVFAANSNDPMILAGMGEIHLLNGSVDSAKLYFEQALSAGRGKDLEVYHAIARANIDAQKGDAKYALNVLTAIPKRKRKDLKNAETYFLAGLSNRKLINGGEAVTAFNQALSMNPEMAAAKYQVGKVYLTQNNPQIFLPEFEEAVGIDNKYAPALYELFFYWFERDINKARRYFTDYLAASDHDASTQYDKVSIIYASRDYQAAIDSAKEKIALRGQEADPRYFKLVAYSYDELNDSAKAKNYLDEYFSRQKADALLAQDYVFKAQLVSRLGGDDGEVNSNYRKALELDSSRAGKQKIMRDAVAFAEQAGNYNMKAEWLGEIYQADSSSSNRDLYDWGYAHYKAGNYVAADSIFCGIYTQKYPDEIFGYLWCARAASAQDTTMEKGIAVEPYKTLIAFARASGEREDYKATLIQAHGYLASYYANVAKDKDSAVAYLQNILKLDPNNTSAGKYIEMLTRSESNTDSTIADTKKKPKKSSANSSKKRKN